MADDNLIPPMQDGGRAAAPTSGSVMSARPVDYREVQGPAEVDVRGIDRAADAAGDEASRRAEALGNVFKQFEGISGGIADHLERQAGAKAGAAAGAQPGYKPMGALAQITAYGQSYTAAAASTYQTQSQLDLEKSLTGIEQNTQSDPIAFQNQASVVAKKTIAAMDPTFQPEMQQWAQARIQAGVNRQQQQKETDVRNEALNTYQTGTPDLITSALHTSAALPADQGDAIIAKLESDDRDKLNALVASHVITPEQATTLHQRMVDNATQQMSGQRVDISLRPVLQTMQTNVEAADKMILQADPNLTPAENAARVSEYEKEHEQFIKTQTLAHVNDLAAVHQQLAGGATGPDVEGQLHQLYQAGAMSEEGYFSGLAESVRNQKNQINDDVDMGLVRDAIAGTRGPLDPKDPGQVAAVDKYFQAHVLAGGASVSDAQYAAGAAEIYRQTEILPPSVQNRVRVGVFSGDPNTAVAAAALAAKIQSVNPSADPFASNKKMEALSSLINDNVKAGLAPGQAYAMAVQAVNVTPEQLKARDASYGKALKAQGPNAVALQAALNTQGKAPPAPVGMQSDYDGLVREFYGQTGDIVKARSIAAAQLRQTWGLSSVNGAPALTKYPVPEAMVPTVRADIASSAKAAGYAGDPAQIHLTPNAATDSTRGQVWSLTYSDPTTGAEDVLLDHKTNRPLQYHLPSNQQFAQARQAQIESKLAQARQLRAEQQKNSLVQQQFEQQLSQQYLSGNSAQRAQAGR